MRASIISGSNDLIKNNGSQTDGLEFYTYENMEQACADNQNKDASVILIERSLLSPIVIRKINANRFLFQHFVVLLDDDQENLLGLLSDGVEGFLFRDEVNETRISTIARHGGPILNAEVMEKLQFVVSCYEASLTEEERQLCHLLFDGYSYHQMAESLNEPVYRILQTAKGLFEKLAGGSIMM